MNLSLLIDAIPSLAHFNDTRCTAGGVCATDPLLFTCELNEIILLKVVLPTGDHESISLGDTAASVALPAGFTAVALTIHVLEINESERNISLTLSIASASLLNCSVITCDDTQGNEMVAGCPVRGKSEQKLS